MFRLLRSDTFRTFRRVSSLIICAIVLVLAFTNTIAYSSERYMYKTIRQNFVESNDSRIDDITRKSYYDQIWWTAYASAFKLGTYLLLIAALVTLSVGSDLSTGKVGELIFSGNTRGSVYIVKIISTYLICLVIPLLGSFLNFFSYPYFWWGHFDVSDVSLLFRLMAYIVPQMLLIIAVFFSSMFIAKKPVHGVLLGLVAFIVLYIVTGIVARAVTGSSGVSTNIIHFYRSLYPTDTPLKALPSQGIAAAGYYDTVEVKNYYNAVSIIQLILAPILTFAGWLSFRRSDLV